MLFPGDSQVRFIAATFFISLMLLVSGCSTFEANSGGTTVLSLRDGILAGELGAGLPEKASKRAAEAEYRALESGLTGAPLAWKVSDAIQGSVVPQQPYAIGAANCRRYTHTVSIDGQIRTATGTACRREDGVWRPLI